MRTALKWLVAGVAAAAASVASAQAENYPNKPIRFIVPYSPGGSTSMVVRLIGDKMAETWKQQVLVENKPGGSTVIGTQALAKSPADGYTIMLVVNSHAANGHLLKNLPYDTMKDFVPVATLVKTELLLDVHPAVAASTLPEFIALLKAKPGAFNVATIGGGGVTRLMTELFMMETGTKAVHISYQGTPPMLTDLIGGQVQFIFDTPVTSLPFVKDKRIKPLAVTGPKRLPAFPDVPTFTEMGMPQIDMNVWFMAIAPAGTPKPIIAKLNAEMNRILTLPDVKQVLAQQIMEPYISTPEEASKLLQSVYDQYGQIIRKAGIKLEQ
ncbi:MAG TPA: tripartite tricarboxylate transporter substrate binding protein [Albitalea sp.]|jgi:tripartite-type tricarboxylate transporter receptor subunit TctC|nr:tripartite tricarboxylate transporter substrate binding protein [Albitalea sp.]